MTNQRRLVPTQSGATPEGTSEPCRVPSRPPASTSASPVSIATDNDGVHVVEVEGGKAHLSLGALRELWNFREVLAAFTARQVKVRYKQAIVGIGWAILQPVLSAILFAVFL